MEQSFGMKNAVRREGEERRGWGGGENGRMRSVLRAVHEDGGSTMLFSLYV